MDVFASDEQLRLLATATQAYCVCKLNLFVFLWNLQRMTRDAMNDVARIDNGLTIRRAKKYVNVDNDKRIKQRMERLDSGAYTRMQILRAVSHSMSQHTTSLQAQLSAGTR